MPESAVNTDQGPIYQRINAAYPTLPAQAQRVADLVLDHLGDIGTYSVAEIAQLSATSPATVSRLFAAVGFSDFAEVKAHVRALRSEGVPLHGDAPSGDVPAGFQRELDNIRRVHDLLDGGQLDDVASIIATADHLMVVGFRNSFPVALHLREALLQCRGHVELAPAQGQSTGEEMANYGPGDVVIVIGFRRRLSQFHDLMRFLDTTGATIILIADPTAKRHARLADRWLICPIDSTGAFDSLASAMSLSSLLADLVLQKLGQAGRRHVVRVASAFDFMSELDAEDQGSRSSDSRQGR
ncbi:MAG TPA: MurR/RpiR family transcriptional regulator [Microlunatus sp.]